MKDEDKLVVADTAKVGEAGNKTVNLGVLKRKKKKRVGSGKRENQLKAVQAVVKKQQERLL